VLLRTSDMKTCEVLCDLAETISHSQWSIIVYYLSLIWEYSTE
jgi:hypothetical protein